RDSPSPELLPDPVTDEPLVRRLPAHDISGDGAVEEDRLLSDGFVREDPLPVREERVAIARRKIRQAHRFGIELLLEEDRQIRLGHAPQPDGPAHSFGDRGTDRDATSSSVRPYSGGTEIPRMPAIM